MQLRALSTSTTDSTLEQPPTLKQLADRLAMTHQNVTQIALALERNGFLEIAIDPSDARVRRLRLTAHHRRFWQRRNPNDYANVAAWTGAVSDAEVHKLVHGLDRLHGDLMRTR